MPRFRRLFAIAGIPLFLASLSLPALSADTLAGRWVLVEQHYGKGQANQAPAENRVRLEFSLEGGQFAGRIWAGESATGAERWPVLAVDGESPEPRIEEITPDPRLNRVRAVYTVEPARDGDTVLRVTEEYWITDDGKSLTGTVTVSLVRAGQPRGSYVLHRRFEREP